MPDRSESEELAPIKATEVGTIFWISIGLGTVASLPMLSDMANGTVSIARGAMWFLVVTLVAMVGVWTISWLMHVFTDPYPDDDVERDDAGEGLASVPAPGATDALVDEGPAADVPAPARSDAPAMSDAP